MSQTIRPYRSATVFDGRITRVTVDDVCLPNGKRWEMEIVHHPGGAAVVALDDRDNICLLHQYRYAVDSWLWELPAGKIEQDEPPLKTAVRELADETGLSAEHWDSLGEVVSSPGIFTEIVHLFLATGLTAGRPQPEDAEVFEMHWMAFSKAMQLVFAGDIVDAKTVVALCRAQARLRSRR